MGNKEEDLYIKQAEKKDLEEFACIYLEGYKGLEEYAYTHMDDVKAYMDWLWRRDSKGIFKAINNNKIVGFVAGDSNWFSKKRGSKVGAVHEIVVLPSFRGRGIGTALMEKVLSYFRDKGLSVVELWVGDENHRAIDFYKNLGFKEEGRYNYWIRMVKNL